jgi:hypothetical protein
VDPRPSPSISVYCAFANNPILLSDPFGDTTRIYGNAEVTNTTLLDKGGVNESSQNSIEYKDATIQPVFAKDGRSLVGYNVYDRKNSKLRHPILQLETESDLVIFKANYEWQFGGAQLYYANGEPSDAMKKLSAGLESGNKELILQGLKEENKAAWSNPVFVTQMILSSARTGAKFADHNSLLIPNREQNRLIKYSFGGVSDATGGRSGGKMPLLGKPNSYTVTKGGHIIFYSANGQALWDVSRSRIKMWEWNNGFPKDAGYVSRDVPQQLKNIIDIATNK